ncbi:hypothetical protein GOV09_03220 [Candidatus Woesearchaeota archaeon]|nr:hypothetical protein [Candidatus Woesearchaeota archaeon]
MLKIEKSIKHDRYLEDLFQRLSSQYDIILKNVPLYSKRKRKVAEIDILACRDGVCDIYEVKCSHRITKARKQLRKIEKLLPSKVRSSFFFCGESGLLTVI